MPPDASGPDGGRVRVVVYARAEPADAGALEEAYHRVSHDLAGTPGLLANELLRSVTDGQAYAVMSEWESVAAFSAWEQGATHRGTTAPLRPFQDRGRGATFEIYAVTAEYPQRGRRLEVQRWTWD